MARSVVRPLSRTVIAALALAALVTQASSMPARAAVVADPQCAGPTSAADTIAPCTPASFRVVNRAKSGSLTLGWVASYDAVGVSGYKLYTNGSWSGTLCQAGVDRLGTVMYSKLTGRNRTAVTYELYAFDVAGNVSAPATLVVTP